MRARQRWRSPGRVASGVALAAIAAIAPVHRAAAQDGRAALPGRLMVSLHEPAAIEGLGAADASRWRAVVARAAELLAEEPDVHTPPAGVCLRLHTGLPGGVEGPRAIGEASVHPALSYDARGCSSRTGAGVTIRLNDAARLLHPDGTMATALRDADGPVVVIPRVGTTRDGRDVLLLNGERAVVLTRGGRPLLVPVTKERFLRHRIAEAERALAEVRAVHVEGADALERWHRETKPQLQAAQAEALRDLQRTASAEEVARTRAAHARMLEQTEEGIRRMATVLAGQDAMKAEAAGIAEGELHALRARLAALPPPERLAPACAPSRPDEVLGACGDHNRYMSLDPGYFSSSLPTSAVQVIVVGTPHGRHPMEPSRHAELRWRIFDGLDFERLATLLH